MAGDASLAVLRGWLRRGSRAASARMRLMLGSPVLSSHAGMSVNRGVYQVLTEILEEETAWSG